MDAYISPQTSLHLARLASFPPALLLTGYTLSLPHATLPALLDHRPQTTTPAFTNLYRSAGPLISTLTLISTSASAYLAYALPAQRREWITAAAAMFLTIPWVGLVMGKGIARLGAIAGDERVVRKSEENLEHTQIFARLVKQGWVLVVLQGLAAGTGLMASVKA